MNNRSELGFSLIEVMVSLLIIAIGVLGAVALQLRAVQAGVESNQRVQALLLAEDMIERIRNNRSFANCYLSGAGYYGAGAGANKTNCNVLSDADILAWDAVLKGASEIMIDASGADGSKVGAMLEARGCVTDLGGGQYSVSVAWKSLTKMGSAGAKNSCASGAYEDDAYRRVLSVAMRIPNLK